MSSNPIKFVFPLSSDRIDLTLAGGKGANLARLLRAGFPVPGGFVVTTMAYTAFINETGLDEAIQKDIQTINEGSPSELQAASARIRERLHQSPIPGEIEAQIRAAYAELGQAKVAVRSSATAEDLPDFSFAGQQDTYLNIAGPQALLDAVRCCWSSLWTARAIGYRAHNQIAGSGLALAVVVQAMVPSQASGVMFTANPLTGNRREMTIDAILGLGEALVSGQSEPDQLVVRKGQPLRIVAKSLGSKSVLIQGLAEGGTQTLQQDASNQQALSDEQALALARLGEQVEAEFAGVPQDIEWGLVDGKLYLLQSRPVTSLYSLLEDIPIEPLQVYGSLAAIQGMLDPITPLGRDGLRLICVNVANMLGFTTSLASTRAFQPAGERLFVNLTPMVRSRIGRKVVSQALKAVEPSIRAALLPMLDDPALRPGKRLISPATAFKLLRLVLPTVARMVVSLLRPDWRRQRTVQATTGFYQHYEQRFQAATTLAQRLDLMDDMYQRLPPVMIRHLIPSFAPGVAMINALYQLAGGTPEDEQRILEVTRGMPYNVTTQMDLALWEVARKLRSDHYLTGRFRAQPARELAGDYLRGQLPAVAQEAIAAFLNDYGARGLGEIDLGHPRWSEDPTPVMEALQSYLGIQDPQAAPDVAFERGRQRAEQAINELCESARKRANNPIRARVRSHQVRFAARRLRALAGLRELPKFFAVKLIGLVRQAMLISGRELAQEGLLTEPQDIFFLFYSELREIAAAQAAQGSVRTETLNRLFAGLNLSIAARRQKYVHEVLRRQLPVLLLSDGRAFYGGSTSEDVIQTSDGKVISGSPVSPGQAEGAVRVVYNPHSAGLQHGEILVCHGTDPSWTPLFMAAGGLVMEVGGLLTHGSVVAREYGIPAVVGVAHATQRLHSGQRIRVDGSSGLITLLEDEVESKGEIA